MSIFGRDDMDRSSIFTGYNDEIENTPHLADFDKPPTVRQGNLDDELSFQRMVLEDTNRHAGRQVRYKERRNILKRRDLNKKSENPKIFKERTPKKEFFSTNVIATLLSLWIVFGGTITYFLFRKIL